MTRTLKPAGIYAGIPGCWVAWVEAGETRDELRRRLGETPEKFRDEVERQVRTVFALSQRRKAT